MTTDESSPQTVVIHRFDVLEKPHPQIMDTSYEWDKR